MTTVSQVIQQAMLLAGTVKTRGSSTASTTTTLTDAGMERAPITDGTVPGTFLTFLTDSGTPGDLGLFRKISSYGTVGVYTWITALPQTPATVTDYIRTAINPQDFIDAMQRLTRDWRRRMALQYTSTSFVIGSILDSDGDFEEWNAAATVPTGWVATNATGAQDTTATTYTPRHGNYALKVTDSGSGGGYFEAKVPAYRLAALEGQALYPHGHAAVQTGTTARVTVLATDNAGTVTTYSWNVTTTSWKRIEDADAATFTLPSTLSALSVRCIVVTASGVCHFDDVAPWQQFCPGVQRLPALMAGVPSEIKAELYPSWGNSRNINAGIFEEPLAQGRHFAIYRDTIDGYPYIRWDADLCTGRHIQIVGWKYPTHSAVFSATVENIGPDPGWLELATAVAVLRTQVDANSRNLLAQREKELAEKYSGNGADDPRGYEHTGIGWVDPY